MGQFNLLVVKLDVLKDSIYYVSFWMKGSANNLDFNAITSFASPPYTALAANSFKTSNQWTEYCYSFSHDSTILGDIRLLKLQFLSAGTYYLDYVNVHGSDFICSPVNLHEIINGEINVFPNPSSSTIHIQSDLIGIDFVSIFNMLGKQIDHIEVYNKTSLDIDISKYEKGNYIIQLYFQNG